MSEEDKGKTKRSFVTPEDRKEKPTKKPNKTPNTPKEKMPLFEKMDKIIEELHLISYQMTRIADHLTGQKTQYNEEGKAKIEKAKKPVKSEPDKSTGTTTTPPDEVTKVMELIPAEFWSNLEFLKRENDVKVNVKVYLGSEDFAKIAGIVRDNGGVYNSAGKDSHFIIPFVKEETTEAPAPPTEAPITDDEQLSPIQKVEVAFPDDLKNMLSFTESDEYITIKPRQYLGSENFAKIASIVREIGGEYISAGKESHFRVAKK